ncbi:SDR family NAD(P)-dependent oxidoreductase [Chloroflexota bacterium]
MYDLTGKVGIVTGAAGKQAFGRAIATRLAMEGVDVVIVDKFTILPREKDLYEDWKGLETVADEIRSLGRKALAVTCDIAQSNEVDSMVEDIVDKFGQVDILVNNAGVQALSAIDSINDETWNANLSVNLTGTFFCSRAVAGDMRKRGQGGKIINIASTNAKVVMSIGRIGYAASKFGVIGLTQSLALELAPYGINVNSICPGQADTGIHSDIIEIEARKRGIPESEVRSQFFGRTTAKMPLRRLVMPEDIANMVAFLASKESEFVTGQSINVNGGGLMAH